MKSFEGIIWKIDILADEEGEILMNALLILFGINSGFVMFIEITSRIPSSRWIIYNCVMTEPVFILNNMLLAMTIVVTFFMNNKASLEEPMYTISGNPVTITTEWTIIGVIILVVSNIVNYKKNQNK